MTIIRFKLPRSNCISLQDIYYSLFVFCVFEVFGFSGFVEICICALVDFFSACFFSDSVVLVARRPLGTFFVARGSISSRAWIEQLQPVHWIFITGQTGRESMCAQSVQSHCFSQTPAGVSSPPKRVLGPRRGGRWNGDGQCSLTAVLFFRPQGAGDGHWR